VTASFSTPGGLRPIVFVKSETIPSESNLTLAGINIDFDYLKTMGIKPVLGRDFNPAMSLDSTQAIIINKQAAIELNFGENPVGKIVEVNQDGDNAFVRKTVIGVVDNVNFEPLYRKTEASFYAPMFPFYTYIFIKLHPNESATTIAHIRNTWQKFVAGQPFDYSFLDTNLNQLYEAEDKLGKVVTYFAFLAIIIACLGLFGLASFATEQRTKEIGIRKVLGASESSILMLLSREYTQIIVIATLISWPLAYYLMYKWMENFAYHTGLRWYVFILAGILVFLIAMFTVSFKALKAAQTNPTKSLRSE
jgi:putative ABC transport system permease protein